VAGIVGQTDAAEAGYVGMAPECTYLIYKALTAQGSGSATGIAAAMEEALADGADLISMSLGGEAPSAEPDFLERRANLLGERIPVVVAAGNSGPKGSKPFRETPARAANVITVGASEKDDDVASFTSRGVTDDGRIKPNVYAPGHQIAAARAAGTTMGTPLSPSTTVASGTSMATPCISGIVAALLSHDPRLMGQPKVLKALLMTRGMPIGAEGPRVVAPSLLEQPYPSPAEGVDRTGEPAPGPEPSPCEELILAALEDRDPVRRRLAVRRAVAVARRELRRLTA
jgi:serine protease AprX